VVAELRRTEICEYSSLKPSFGLVSEVKKSLHIEKYQGIARAMTQPAVTETADAGLGAWVVVEFDSKEGHPPDVVAESSLENQTIYDGIIYENRKIKGTLPRISSKGNEVHSVKSSSRRFGWSTLSAKLKKIIKNFRPTPKTVEGEEVTDPTINN